MSWVTEWKFYELELVVVIPIFPTLAFASPTYTSGITRAWGIAGHEQHLDSGLRLLYLLGEKRSVLARDENVVINRSKRLWRAHSIATAAQ